MSTAYGGYPASQAIDGNINTMAVTQVGMNNWLSIRLSESTDVRYVGVVNRQDQYASLLGCFEIYLGRFMFNELAVQCGGVQCYDRVVCKRRAAVRWWWRGRGATTSTSISRLAATAAATATAITSTSAAATTLPGRWSWLHG